MSDLLELEAAIKRLPGVLGCVILSTAGELPSEIQAFTKIGVDRAAIQEQILHETQARSLEGALDQVLVFELETEAFMGGPDSLRQAELLAELEALAHEDSAALVSETAVRHGIAPGRTRPVLRRVLSFSTTWRSEAEVTLEADEGGEVVGAAVGEHAAHGLQMLAQATIDAVHKLHGEEPFSLGGTWLAEILGREVVVCFVTPADGRELVGAALVRGGALKEAAVRATLDAVNRRLAGLE